MPPPLACMATSLFRVVSITLLPVFPLGNAFSKQSQTSLLHTSSRATEHLHSSKKSCSFFSNYSSLSFSKTSISSLLSAFTSVMMIPYNFASAAVCFLCAPKYAACCESGFPRLSMRSDVPGEAIIQL
ncbi:hypothetical protein V6N13_111600 [Hibiscus sabdariffa]